MKIVLNRKHGGFGLSSRAVQLYAEMRGVPPDSFSFYSLPRTDPNLIAVVEQLGDAVNTKYSKLQVVHIPDGISYEIVEEAGFETLHESHRVWPQE